MTRSPSRTPWLRSLCAPGNPRARLVCFPHAGGSPAAYRDWAPLVPAGIALEAVCYPGRLDRIGEPPVDDMDALLDAVEIAYRSTEPVPTAFFGHSMGAALAHELTLRVAGTPWEPVLLTVSGRAAPHRISGRGVASQGDDAIVADVVALNPNSEAIMSDPEMRALLLPAIRADYTLIENVPRRERPRIGVSVLALNGDSDPIVDPADVARWADTTTGAFTSRTFTGGHFYLEDHRAEVVTALGDLLVRELAREDAKDVRG